MLSPLGCYCPSHWLSGENPTTALILLVPFPLAHSGIHGTTQEVSLIVRQVVTLACRDPTAGSSKTGSRQRLNKE